MRCKICNSSNIQLLDENQNYKLFRCCVCNFVYKDIEEVNYDILTEDNYVCYNFDRTREAIELAKVIKKFSKREPINILEIGSGTGSLLYSLNKLGYNVLGIEPNRAAYNLALQNYPNIKVINSYFNAKMLNNNNFDVIILYDVIEHLEPNNKLFKEISDFMTDNMVLLIKSGNPSSLNAKLSIEKWQYVHVKQHIFFIHQRLWKFLLKVKA